MDTEVRGKSLCLCRRSNLDRLVAQFVARHYTEWATPAPIVHGKNFNKSETVLTLMSKILSNESRVPLIGYVTSRSPHKASLPAWREGECFNNDYTLSSTIVPATPIVNKTLLFSDWWAAWFCSTRRVTIEMHVLTQCLVVTEAVLRVWLLHRERTNGHSINKKRSKHEKKRKCNLNSTRQEEANVML
jgi:hypothetical protein